MVLVCASRPAAASLRAWCGGLVVVVCVTSLAAPNTLLIATLLRCVSAGLNLCTLQRVTSLAIIKRCCCFQLPLCGGVKFYCLIITITCAGGTCRQGAPV